MFSTKKQNVHKKLDFFTIGFMSKMAAAASRVRVIDLIRSGQVRSSLDRYRRLKVHRLVFRPIDLKFKIHSVGIEG